DGVFAPITVIRVVAIEPWRSMQRGHCQTRPEGHETFVATVGLLKRGSGLLAKIVSISQRPAGNVNTISARRSALKPAPGNSIVDKAFRLYRVPKQVAGNHP